MLHIYKYSIYVCLRVNVHIGVGLWARLGSGIEHKSLINIKPMEVREVPKTVEVYGKSLQFCA